MGAPVKNCEAVVVGAGPAGLKAAIQLADFGVEVMVCDEKPVAGGQLFKQIHKFFGSEQHMAGVRGFEIGNMLLEGCRERNIPILLDTAVWGMYPDKTIAVDHKGKLMVIKSKSIVIATGAGENPLSFPGWTLPGIMGAGAAQTLVNYYRVKPGSKALIVGAGNVGLIVAYQLIQAGIEVAGVVEGMDHVGGYMVHASKIRRMGVPIYTHHTIVKAEGNESITKCTICEVDGNFHKVNGTGKEFEIDLLLIAAGLSPAIELCRVMGMKIIYVKELGGYLPVHNENLLSTVPGVYIAGDVSGIEEASSAMEEGKLSAISIAGSLGRISTASADRMKRETIQTLNTLRNGPFGAMVARRKTEIFQRFKCGE